MTILANKVKKTGCVDFREIFGEVWWAGHQCAGKKRYVLNIKQYREFRANEPVSPIMEAMEYIEKGNYKV